MVTTHDFKVNSIYHKGEQLEMVKSLNFTFSKGIYTIVSHTYLNFTLHVIKDGLMFNQVFNQPHINLEEFLKRFRPLKSSTEGLKL